MKVKKSYYYSGFINLIFSSSFGFNYMSYQLLKIFFIISDTFDEKLNEQNRIPAISHTHKLFINSLSSHVKSRITLNQNQYSKCYAILFMILLSYPLNRQFYLTKKLSLEESMQFKKHIELTTKLIKGLELNNIQLKETGFMYKLISIDMDETLLNNQAEITKLPLFNKINISDRYNET